MHTFRRIEALSFLAHMQRMVVDVSAVLLRLAFINEETMNDEFMGTERNKKKHIHPQITFSFCLFLKQRVMNSDGGGDKINHIFRYFLKNACM